MNHCLDALLLAAATTAVLRFWFLGSVFEVWREYAKAQALLPGWSGWCGKLKTCALCLSFHVSFWLAVLFLLPGVWLSAPLAAMLKLPLVVLAAAALVPLAYAEGYSLSKEIPVAEPDGPRRVVDLLEAQTLSTMNTMGGPDVVVLTIRDARVRGGVVVIVREGVNVTPDELIELSKQLMGAATLLLKTAQRQLHAQSTPPEVPDGQASPAAGVNQTGATPAVRDRIDRRAVVEPGSTS